MSRLPIRVRLTLAFALAMALVLAGMGLFVYLRVGDALLASVDQTLRAQAREAVAHARDEHGLVDPDTAAGTTLAQVLDAQGFRVVRLPRVWPPLLDPATAARAVRGSVRTTITLPRYDGRWRVLAVPTADGTATVVVARSLDQREETLDHLLRELLIVSPLALLLRLACGLRARGRRAAAG